MNRIVHVARNTFRESIREKLLYLVCVYGLMLLVSVCILSPLSVGVARGKIVTDVGLAGISLFGILTAVVVGSTLVRKEIDKKAIFMVLTRPVSRAEYLLGKFGGIMLSLLLLVGIMTVLLVAFVLVSGGALRGVVFAAVLLSLVEIALICSVVIFFSTFATPVLTSFFTLGVFVAGYLGSDLRAFAQRFGGEAMKRIMDGLYIALPNLAVFNLRSEAVHDLHFSAGEIVYPLLYGAAYTAALLYFAYLVLLRREFS